MLKVGLFALALAASLTPAFAGPRAPSGVFGHVAERVAFWPGAVALRNHVPCPYPTSLTDGCANSMDTPPSGWPYAFMRSDLYTTYPITGAVSQVGSNVYGWTNTSQQNAVSGYVTRPNVNMGGSEFPVGVNYWGMATPGVFKNPTTDATTGCNKVNVPHQPPWIATPLIYLQCMSDFDLADFDFRNTQPGGVPIIISQYPHNCHIRNSIIGPTPAYLLTGYTLPVTNNGGCDVSGIVMDNVWVDGGTHDYVNVNGQYPGSFVGGTAPVFVTNSYVAHMGPRFVGITPNGTNCNGINLNLKYVVYEGNMGSSQVHGDSTLTACNTPAIGVGQATFTGYTMIQGGPEGGSTASGNVIPMNLNGNNPTAGFLLTMNDVAMMSNPSILVFSGSLDASLLKLTVTSQTPPTNSPVSFLLQNGFSIYTPNHAGSYNVRLAGNAGWTSALSSPTGFEGEYELDPAGPTAWSGSPGMVDVMVSSRGAVVEGYVTDGSTYYTAGRHLTITKGDPNIALQVGDTLTDSGPGGHNQLGAGVTLTTFTSANGGRGVYNVTANGVTSVSFTGTMASVNSPSSPGELWLDGRIGFGGDPSTYGFQQFIANDLTFDPSGSPLCVSMGLMNGAVSVSNWRVMTTGDDITPTPPLSANITCAGTFH